MRECDNSKIHISSNFLLSIYLIIMLDNLLLVPPWPRWHISVYICLQLGSQSLDQIHMELVSPETKNFHPCMHTQRASALSSLHWQYRC